MGSLTLDISKSPLEPIQLRAARCARDLRSALDAGITSVREVGGMGVYLARAVAEGSLAGPAIYGAGAILSTTGGHADLHSYPLDWIGHGVPGIGRLADGPAECARAAREQLRLGARLIKVCASGGVLSELDHPMHQQFTAAELRAIVEVAGLADRVVAAHCHGKPGILAAIEAGAKTIEHGTYLDDECCDAMRETSAILVPTRTIIADMMANKAAVPDYAYAKLEAIAAIHADAVARAHERGVTIAMGTDILVSTPGAPASWGTNGAELRHLVDLGLSPLEAIQTATAIAPQTLGPQAPRSGLLAAGYDADVITLSADPLTDIVALTDPANVVGVWTAGQQVKGCRAA
jgi:imidazolonepropionase-like amidohydrolase